MWKWIGLGVLAIGAAIALYLTLGRDTDVPSRDATVEDFRATERACIAAFNDALRRQRSNEIDELELSNIIERDVLVPWRAVRTRVTAAQKSSALYTTLAAYLESRQIAWEAYAAALRATDDTSARPHYDVYHQKNAEAQTHAQALGKIFREQRL